MATKAIARATCAALVGFASATAPEPRCAAGGCAELDESNLMQVHRHGELVKDPQGGIRLTATEDMLNSLLQDAFKQTLEIDLPNIEGTLLGETVLLKEGGTATLQVGDAKVVLAAGKATVTMEKVNLDIKSHATIQGKEGKVTASLTTGDDAIVTEIEADGKKLSVKNFNGDKLKLNENKITWKGPKISKASGNPANKIAEEVKKMAKSLIENLVNSFANENEKVSLPLPGPSYFQVANINANVVQATISDTTMELIIQGDATAKEGIQYPAKYNYTFGEGDEKQHLPKYTQGNGEDTDFRITVLQRVVNRVFYALHATSRLWVPIPIPLNTGALQLMVPWIKHFPCNPLGKTYCHKNHNESLPYMDHYNNNGESYQVMVYARTLELKPETQPMLQYGKYEADGVRVMVTTAFDFKVAFVNQTDFKQTDLKAFTVKNKMILGVKLGTTTDMDPRNPDEQISSISMTFYELQPGTLDAEYPKFYFKLQHRLVEFITKTVTPMLLKVLNKMAPKIKIPFASKLKLKVGKESLDITGKFFKTKALPQYVKDAIAPGLSHMIAGILDKK